MQMALPDDESSRILLLLGLLPPSFAGERGLPVAAELADFLVGRWRRLEGAPWLWRLRPETVESLATDEARGILARAAEILLEEVGGIPSRDSRGLRLEATRPEEMGGVGLTERLVAAGADSVYLRLADEDEVAWSWPLRIGHRRESGLLDGIDSSSALRGLYTSHPPGAPVRFHLLFLESSLAEAVDELSCGPRPTTEAVVLFGGLGPDPDAADREVELLRGLTGAEGVVVFYPSEGGELPSYLAERLIRSLSHARPLDSAVGEVARPGGISAVSWCTRPLALASSVREQARILARQMQRMPRARIDVPPTVQAAIQEADFVPGTLESYEIPEKGPKPLRETAAELGVELERRLPPPSRRMLSAEMAPPRGRRDDPVRRRLAYEPHPATPMREIHFDAESAGAAAVADVARAVEEAAEVDDLEPVRRHLQARVETPSGRTVGAERPLRPHRSYEARVVIGARRHEWLGLDEPLDEPPPRPDGQPLGLRVTFWEPEVCPEPEVLPMKLYPVGDSEEVAFPFDTGEPGPFSARIAVYHRNRNLQTGLLRGRVGDEAAELEFVLDATPQRRFLGLADRAGVGASIIVNDDPSGRMRAFTFRDGEAAVADLSDPVGIDPGRGLDALTEALGRGITRITRSPEDYDDLSKEGSRVLLRNLALHGSALLQRLRRHDALDGGFDDVGRVQIVRAHVDAFFPAEFLYAGEPPEDDATICDGRDSAETALGLGRCCGAYDGDPEHVVCPLRFWSLSKVIERQAHVGEHRDLATEFELRRLPATARQRVLDPLAGALLAASDRVDAAVPATVETLHRKLETLVRRRPVKVVEDWGAWATEIAASRPHLLVLLPHHLHQDGFDLLEIGNGQARKSMQIRRRHVCAGNGAGVQGSSPVVLLIGCETESAKIDFESFVPAFQDAGAAVVVSTLASILGRHAGPATAVLVEEIRRIQDDPEATFGQAMLAARRRLLAEGTPMVLGLTSYGDADWRIAAGPESP